MRFFSLLFHLLDSLRKNTSTKQFKGEKVTLRPPPSSVDDIDRSVTARAIVVHEKADNGGPPFGGVRIKHQKYNIQLNI